MTITLAGLANDAMTRWRRDGAVLIALTGVFLFLPMLAWLLLVPKPDIKVDADDTEKMRMLLVWVRANAHWLAARIGFELFGAATILTLYLSRAHHDVAGTLRTALGLLPTFVPGVLRSWGLVALGAFPLLLPGMYIYGRLCLTGPVLVAEPGVGITGAIGRSITLTRGHGWQVFGYLALVWLLGMLMVQVIGAVELGMTSGGPANPVAVAILGVLAAAVVTVTELIRLLFVVSLYRLLSRR